MHEIVGTNVLDIDKLEERDQKRFRLVTVFFGYILAGGVLLVIFTSYFT